MAWYDTALDMGLDVLEILPEEALGVDFTPDRETVTEVMVDAGLESIGIDIDPSVDRADRTEQETALWEDALEQLPFGDAFVQAGAAAAEFQRASGEIEGTSAEAYLDFMYPPGAAGNSNQPPTSVGTSRPSPTFAEQQPGTPMEALQALSQLIATASAGGGAFGGTNATGDIIVVRSSAVKATLAAIRAKNGQSDAKTRTHIAQQIQERWDHVYHTVRSDVEGDPDGESAFGSFATEADVPLAAINQPFVDFIKRMVATLSTPDEIRQFILGISALATSNK